LATTQGGAGFKILFGIGLLLSQVHQELYEDSRAFDKPLEEVRRHLRMGRSMQQAVETLKGIMVKAPVLKLPDFDKDFEIHSDASDFVIRGVLVQEGRPMAFESKKLSETEQRWPTHGKDNVVPNVLSRKHQLRVVYVGETELQKEVRLANHRDAFAKEARQNIQNGTKSHFHLQNGLLWYKQK